MPIAENVKLGKDVKIPYPSLVNIYGSDIGNEVFVGPFVEIQNGTIIGDFTRVQSHSFICEGVCIGMNVFIGHGVIFINDRHPRVNNKNWVPAKVIVEDMVSIGSGALIMDGVHLGKGCIIGAGAVVTKNVSAGVIVAGVPARLLKS